MKTAMFVSRIKPVSFNTKKKQQQQQQQQQEKNIKHDWKECCKR